MNQANKGNRRRRSNAVVLGAILLAGCQPEGAGSIAVNRGDPAVRRFKNLEDVKRPRSARDARKPASQRDPANANFR